MKTKEIITYVLIIALLYLVMNKNENIEGFQWSSLRCRDVYNECARRDAFEIALQTRAQQGQGGLLKRPNPAERFRRIWR